MSVKGFDQRKRSETYVVTLLGCHVHLFARVQTSHVDKDIGGLDTIDRMGEFPLGLLFM